MLGDDGTGTPAPEGMATPAAPSGGAPRLPLRIEMDLRFDAGGRPSGSVWTAAAVPHQVFGWLELMSELTRLLSDDTDAEPTPPPTPAAARDEDAQAHEETRQS